MRHSSLLFVTDVFHASRSLFNCERFITSDGVFVFKMEEQTWFGRELSALTLHEG